jgi:hypothetical protein
MHDGRRLAVNADGTRIAMCDILGGLRVWDGHGNELRRLPNGLYTDESVFDLAFTPDGRYLVACPLTHHQYALSTRGSNINRLYLFDLVEHRNRAFDPEAKISHAVFSPDGSRLLWGAWDGKVRAWDLAAAAQLWERPVGSGSRLLAQADGGVIAATYVGEVVALDPGGRELWRKNLTPLCYPADRYEPRFLRGVEESATVLMDADEAAGVRADPVRQWEVAGPFASKGPMRRIDPGQSGYAGAGDRSLTWRPHETDDGYVDFLMLATPPYTHICSYAKTVVKSPKQRRVRIQLGHNFGMVIWQNGREVYREDGPFWWAPDASFLETTLEEGDNHFLVGVNQLAKSYGDYGFWFSIAHTSL